jgi:hypothetical protein
MNMVVTANSTAALKERRQDKESKIQGQDGKAARDQSRRFLVIQRFHFGQQHGKTYPSQVHYAEKAGRLDIS